MNSSVAKMKPKEIIAIITVVKIIKMQVCCSRGGQDLTVLAVLGRTGGSMRFYCLTTGYSIVFELLKGLKCCAIGVDLD